MESLKKNNLNLKGEKKTNENTLVIKIAHLTLRTS